MLRAIAVPMLLGLLCLLGIAANIYTGVMKVRIYRQLHIPYEQAIKDALQGQLLDSDIRHSVPGEPIPEGYHVEKGKFHRGAEAWDAWVRDSVSTTREGIDVLLPQERVEINIRGTTQDVEPGTASSPDRSKKE